MRNIFSTSLSFNSAKSGKLLSEKGVSWKMGSTMGCNVPPKAKFDVLWLRMILCGFCKYHQKHFVIDYSNKGFRFMKLVGVFRWFGWNENSRNYWNLENISM